MPSLSSHSCSGKTRGFPVVDVLYMRRNIARGDAPAKKSPVYMGALRRSGSFKYLTKITIAIATIAGTIAGSRRADREAVKPAATCPR